MLLHHNEKLFREIIYSAASDLQLPVPIIEKDYYVTAILKKLSEKAPECVFKGGTSLSKCYHVIERFSEDIDISFSRTLTQGQRKILKNTIIDGISKELRLPISDWSAARSRRDYNCYTFLYDAVSGNVPNSLVQGVKMEIALGTISFPTEILPVDSYIYQFLSKENMNIVNDFDLHPFQMHLQSLERTFVDKIFAVCDYYMTDKIKRNSRHLYDIYMLMPHVRQDAELCNLVHAVRKARAEMGISVCPSAQKRVSIPDILQDIISKNVYKNDYETITTYFQNKPLSYANAISALKQIADGDLFEE